jgi:catechol 2,3-dioxygenase-like lactoylglutathione lyase family enzyme
VTNLAALHHVGYWVDDLEAAMSTWREDLGVGPFNVIEHVPFDSFDFVDGDAVESGITFDHSAAFAAWGSIVVELGQVNAIDERLAAAYGVQTGGVADGAVSHVSWIVDDVDAESARLASIGCTLINRARSGPINVAWHSGGPLFPHPIELHQSNDVICGMHDRLVALREAERAVEHDAEVAR